ncbi:hypothetical protein JVU11DRAFT_10400 [Chiua virens]|nr:hypothetical protein JVU11DRAFT_10400 [Chiua virens]
MIVGQGGKINPSITPMVLAVCHKTNREFSTFCQAQFIFCGQPDPQTGFSWKNVITFLELTSFVYSAQLWCNIICKAYAVFMSQPSRCFVAALSITHWEFHLHIFDRVGAIHSLGYDIHKFADLFIQVIYVFAFGNPAVLRFDTTFINPTLSPLFLHQPRSGSAIERAWLIHVRETAYAVVHPIFISHLICGRATSSWLVTTGKKWYVIKDYWAHNGRKFTEEEILKKIAGLLRVPELVESWTVQVDVVNEMTDLL